MEAWALIVGTLAGFITAFLAEPVKMYFANRNERIKLREALYRELSYLYKGWHDFFDLVASGTARHIDHIKENVEIAMRSDCYDHAKSKPVVFYSLAEATIIDSVYGNYQRAERLILKEDVNVGLQFAEGAHDVFEKVLRENSINQRLLLRVARPEERKILAGVLAKDQPSS